ncbi:hypothetical protein, partial [Luedemannella flava]|uniref:hypothetical protein n=1 Tax=Luedemannella flava TaxID=349316 RepID=UPI0031CE722A
HPAADVRRADERWADHPAADERGTHDGRPDHPAADVPAPDLGRADEWRTDHGLLGDLQGDQLLGQRLPG